MYYNNDCLKRAVCSSCNKRVSRFYNMSLRLRSSVYGGVPEWPKGTDCKSAASSFGGSNPPSSTSSSQASYRLRRAFSFHCKAHRALILLLLASKSQPLALGCDLVFGYTPESCGIYTVVMFPVVAKFALRPRIFYTCGKKGVCAAPSLSTNPPNYPYRSRS